MQAGVDTETLLIVTEYVTTHANDKQEIEPTLQALDELPQPLGKIEAILADNGCRSGSYLAYGADKDRMRAYRLPDGHEIPMFFHGCTRFLDDPDIISGPEQAMEASEIREQFGLDKRRRMMGGEGAPSIERET